MIAVVGPTASGKSDLAVEICKEFGGEVISCDSMQLYRKMNIGTAKPSIEEMQDIAHHMIDILDMGEEYSVSDYVRDASLCCDRLFDRGVIPVFCGGTGLYISSFLSGVTYSDFENSPEVRARIEKQVLDEGIGSVYAKLALVDPESAESIDVNNQKRVIRALEVYETTGVTFSEWNRRSKETAVRKDCLVIGLDYQDRETLYSRIDIRVDRMIEAGLLEETETLIKDGLLTSKTASQAIAYKEFFPYFNGTDSLENCIETLKRNSRRYAKRQLTWFRRDENVNWIFRDGKSFDDIKREAFALVERYLSEGNDG